MRDTIDVIGWTAVVVGVTGFLLMLFVSWLTTGGEDAPWMSRFAWIPVALFFGGIIIVLLVAPSIGPASEGDICVPGETPPPGFVCR